MRRWRARRVTRYVTGLGRAISQRRNSPNYWAFGERAGRRQNVAVLEEESGVWCFTDREQPVEGREHCRILRAGQTGDSLAAPRGAAKQHGGQAGPVGVQ